MLGYMNKDVIYSTVCSGKELEGKGMLISRGIVYSLATCCISVTWAIMQILKWVKYLYASRVEGCCNVLWSEIRKMQYL